MKCQRSQSDETGIRGIESDDYADLAGLSFVRGYLKLYEKAGPTRLQFLSHSIFRPNSRAMRSLATKSEWVTNSLHRTWQTDDDFRGVVVVVL